MTENWSVVAQMCEQGWESDKYVYYLDYGIYYVCVYLCIYI